jgi:hypothetical protein
LISTAAVSSSCCLVTTVIEDARSSSLEFRRVPERVFEAR